MIRTLDDIMYITDGQDPFKKHLIYGNGGLGYKPTPYNIIGGTISVEERDGKHYYKFDIPTLADDLKDWYRESEGFENENKEHIPLNTLYKLKKNIEEFVPDSDEEDEYEKEASYIDTSLKDEFRNVGIEPVNYTSLKDYEDGIKDKIDEQEEEIDKIDNKIYHLDNFVREFENDIYELLKKKKGGIEPTDIEKEKALKKVIIKYEGREDFEKYKDSKKELEDLNKLYDEKNNYLETLKGINFSIRNKEKGLNKWLDKKENENQILSVKDRNLRVLNKFINKYEDFTNINKEFKEVVVKPNLSEEERLATYERLKPDLNRLRRETTNAIDNILNEIEKNNSWIRSFKVGIEKTQNATKIRDLENKIRDKEEENKRNQEDLKKELQKMTTYYKDKREYYIEEGTNILKFDIGKKEIKGDQDIEIYEDFKVSEAKAKIEEYGNLDDIYDEILEDDNISRFEEKFGDLFVVPDLTKKDEKIAENIVKPTDAVEYLTQFFTNQLVQQNNSLPKRERKTKEEIEQEVDERVNEEMYDKKTGKIKSGKALEFNVCGLDNPYAKKLYNVENPDYQVSDFIVDEIGVKLGGQFCQDNLDLRNYKANEMKDYGDINFHKKLELNANLMLGYYNRLRINANELKEEYENTGLKKLQDEWNEIINILNDRKKFEKKFYGDKDQYYFGVALTLNKWDNEAIIPPVRNDVNTKEALELIKSNCSQKFRPVMIDENGRVKRKIFRYTKEVGDDKNKFNTDFNRRLNISYNNPYSLTVTCRFKGCIGVYDYTNDKLVKDGYVLNYYKGGYAHDKRRLIYNSVLIPLNKFILKR